MKYGIFSLYARFIKGSDIWRAVPSTVFDAFYVANDFFLSIHYWKNFAFRIIVEVVSASWVVLCLLDSKYRPKFSLDTSQLQHLFDCDVFANLFGQHQSRASGAI